MRKASFCLMILLLGLVQACASTGWQQSVTSYGDKPTAYRVRGQATADTSVVLSDQQTRALSRHLAVEDAEKKLRAQLMQERMWNGKTLGEVVETDTSLRARMEALVKRATRVDVRWTSPHKAEVMLELKKNDIDQLIDSYRVMQRGSSRS